MRTSRTIWFGLALSMLAALPAQPQPTQYGDLADTFTAAIHQGKFVMIFFHDTGPNTDLMKPVVKGIAQEAVFQHHAAFGDVDIAHDEAGLQLAKELGLTRLPTVSVFMPDAKHIAEIARLEGFQHPEVIRMVLLQRMCGSIQKKYPAAPAMDDELSSACKQNDAHSALQSPPGTIPAAPSRLDHVRESLRKGRRA